LPSFLLHKYAPACLLDFRQLLEISHNAQGFISDQNMLRIDVFLLQENYINKFGMIRAAATFLEVLSPGV